MIDMSQNRVPYGLLTDEEKAALHEHEYAGGRFEDFFDGKWGSLPRPTWHSRGVYRTVPLPLTQDEIAWDRLPDWVEHVARDASDYVIAFESVAGNVGRSWYATGRYRRIDDFPGMVLKRGTCDWKDSKQRRPK